MATTVNSVKFSSQFNWDVENTTTFGDYGTSGSNAPSSSDNTFAHGTGANQADLVHIVQTTIAAGANLDLDLSGSMVDAVGNAFVLARIKGIYIRQIASSGNTGTHVLVGNTVANGVVDWVIPVRRGGVLSTFAPDSTGIATVTAATADIFRVTNGDGANPVEIFLAIVGASV